MAQIITSQHYLDDATIADKQAAKDYSVMLSPVFDLDGETFQVVIDGNHSLAAALVDGVEPDYSVATIQDSDAVALIERGDIEGYLETANMGEGDWLDAVTRKAVW
jgi:hypothetical protein